MPTEPCIPVERARQFLAAVRGHAQMIADGGTAMTADREDARLIIRAADALEVLCREAVVAFRLANGPTTCSGDTEVK